MDKAKTGARQGAAGVRRKLGPKANIVRGKLYRPNARAHKKGGGGGEDLAVAGRLYTIYRSWNTLGTVVAVLSLLQDFVHIR